MGHMLMTMLLLTMAVVEGTPGGVPLLAFVSRAGFGATNKGGATDNRGRSTVVGVPPLSPTIPAFRTHEERSQLHVHHGIPKLFRWLVDLYPIVLESVGEGLSGSNAMAVDNFYLDMNGIIHTCTHTNNDKLVTLNEREMFQRIFSYTDRLYKLVRPSRLMFLAVDGVAPRAKMNQQRSRRFRSSKEREALLADYVAKEGKLPDEESFDSNCITPGTDFMFRLGIAFRRWIAYKMETDPFWQTGAEVVFSGPDVPGEGEHKVMDMIRSLKVRVLRVYVYDGGGGISGLPAYPLSTTTDTHHARHRHLHRVPLFSFAVHPCFPPWPLSAPPVQAKDPDYVPGKLRHCMYGLDADLIMLSLVTHEPFFVLLREKISRRKQNKDAMSYSPGTCTCHMHTPPLQPHTLCLFLLTPCTMGLFLPCACQRTLSCWKFRCCGRC